MQDGAELTPTFSWPQERLLLLIAGGDDALLKAVEGAEDETGARRRADAPPRRRRAPMCSSPLAASGTTPFTLACLREARTHAARSTIGVANNRDTPLLAEAEHAIFLDTGPEAIAGSTRMKAGTAQRIALLLLSSLVMILLGRVYEGLMVDVQASNKKLVRRSENILARLTGRESAKRSTRRCAARGRQRQARLSSAAGLRARRGGSRARRRAWSFAPRVGDARRPRLRLTRRADRRSA